MPFKFPLLLLISVLSGLPSPSISQQYQQQPGGGGVRVAPGVPPQHYQQVPQHQQHQQFQQQQPHHIPVQQQVPVQLQQQQQFQQQQQQQHIPQQQQLHVPQQVQHGHHHGGGHDQARLMDASNVMKEREHIQEHMDVPIDTSQMSEQELQFHYFKMHDADNNNKLDGCELVKSLIHWHDQSNHDPRAGHAIPEPKIFKDEELIQMIDPILQNDDKNRDGMIDYMEFSLAQANAAARGGGTVGGGAGAAGGH